MKARGGEGLLLATNTPHFGDPGVGIQGGGRGELGAGPFDVVFYAQPVEQGALGLLLAGAKFYQVPDALPSVLCRLSSRQVMAILLGRLRICL